MNIESEGDPIYPQPANLLIFIHNIDVKKLDDSPLSVNDVDKWVIARQKVIIFTAYMKQDCIFS